MLGRKKVIADLDNCVFAEHSSLEIVWIETGFQVIWSHPVRVLLEKPVLRKKYIANNFGI